jgi:hypothetical protein
LVYGAKLRHTVTVTVLFSTRFQNSRFSMCSKAAISEYICSKVTSAFRQLCINFIISLPTSSVTHFLAGPSKQLRKHCIFPLLLALCLMLVLLSASSIKLNVCWVLNYVKADYALLRNRRFLLSIDLHLNASVSLPLQQFTRCFFDCLKHLMNCCVRWIFIQFISASSYSHRVVMAKLAFFAVISFWCIHSLLEHYSTKVMKRLF